MKKMNHNIAFLIIIFNSISFCGCSFTPVQQDSHVKTGIIIDFKDIQTDHHSIDCDRIIRTLQFIPLEFCKDCAISYISQLYIYKDTFFILSKNDIYLFSTQGKFIKRFAKRGKGPGEYLSALDFTIDPATKQLHVYDYLQKKIHIYLMNGTFVNSINVGYIYGSAKLKENQLLIYPMNIRGDEPNKLVLINGDGDTLKTYKNYFTYQFKSLFMIPYSNGFYRYNDRLYFRQFLSDTLYCFDSPSQELVPQYIFNGINTLPVSLLGDKEKYYKEENDYSYLQWVQETDKYLFFYFKLKKRYKKAIYLKDKNELYEIDNSSKNEEFKFSFNQSAFYWPDKINSDGTLISEWSALSFKKYFKKIAADKKSIDKLNEYGISNFKDLYNSITENDNPILQIITLK